VPTPPPVFSQTKHDNCTLACLRMILAYHGIEVAETELEVQANKEPGGVYIENLAMLAKRYGFSAEIAELDLDAIRNLVARGVFPIVYLNRVYFEKIPDRLSVRPGERPVPRGCSNPYFVHVRYLQRPLAPRKAKACFQTQVRSCARFCESPLCRVHNQTTRMKTIHRLVALVRPPAVSAAPGCQTARKSPPPSAQESAACSVPAAR
jgi:hypothetical protein